MIEKFVTLPVKGMYYAGKAGVNALAKGARKAAPSVAPVLDTVDVTDYCRNIAASSKNKDIAEHIEKNPGKIAALEACIQDSLKNHKTARKWAGVVDTVDRLTAPVGAAADYLIFMTGTAGFALGLAEEAAEFAAFKAPFLVYYAAKNPQRIPGLVACEFLSHALPFGDALDLMNTYTYTVDYDIKSNAVQQFRKQEGLKKPGFLSRLWRKNPSATTAAEKEEKKMEKNKENIDNLVGLPNPFIECENRIREYMNDVEQDSYDAFMQEENTALPASLERFVEWGYSPGKAVKWFTSNKKFSENGKKITDLVNEHLGPQTKNDIKTITGAYELKIAGETKYVVDVREELLVDYRDAHNVPDEQVAPCVMVTTMRNHKVILDAETGKVEDSYMGKKKVHNKGPIIGLGNTAEYKQLAA
ncbi:hypothetical protein GF343_03165 [Candidatus Woesearchaeota archaeon]|nr:hypothetical protein [Candidatus Woesearchaeota archaeon]